MSAKKIRERKYQNKEDLTVENINLLIEQQEGRISLNFEELKESLARELEAYQNMVFTEETKKDAKASVAELRKLKKAVSDKRIEVKKAFMVPYDEFEKKVKELDALIDEPIRFISGQIDAFEEKRLEEKRALIQQIYDENIRDMADILPLQKIYDSRWENATVSRKAISEAIAERVSTAERDVETIRSMSSDAAEKALDIYKCSYSLNDAITYITNYERQKEQILKAQEERARREAETIETVTEQQVQPAQPIPPVEPQKDAADAVHEPQKNTAVYEVEADAFQLAQMESAMRSYKITYRRVR